MKIVTAEQMREIDKRAAEEYDVPSLLLMENAGLETCRAAISMLSDLLGNSVLIVAGKGNNGGDGFAAARHLTDSGVAVTVALAADADEVKGDARANLEIVFRMGIRCLQVADAADIRELLASCDLVIDALLGTGVKGPVTGIAADIINAINESGNPVISIDLPSGVSADTGERAGPCVHATQTITLALPKIGLVTYPAAEHVGRLTVTDIGIPKALIDKSDLKLDLLTDEMIRERLPVRKADAHKGAFGHLGVFAGSVGMTGAASLTSEAAARVGAGMVTLGCPWSLNDILEVKLTEAMTVPLPETATRSISRDAVDAAASMLKRCNSVAIGPGLGRDPDTVRFVHALLSTLDLPAVIDADGLNALAEKPEVLKNLKSPAVITPHPGEMSRLIGTTSAAIQSDRLKAAAEAAARFGTVVVLKGARTVIAAPDGRAFISPTGNPGMASGGVGDVLTGAIGGFLAQGLSALDAAICGVYLHGLAGDLAAEDLAEAGLIASDLLPRLPPAIRGLRTGD
ncbi:MAG: NAD(P)H-hydrate dehydratase [Armatimonadota bacterium]|nr:NAD(P)H-hydrate dehydratase [Armatimonadota bacterium]